MALDKGLFDLAEAVGGELLTLNPRDAAALNLQGRLALKLGRPDIAAKRFREALDADPYFKAARAHLEEAERLAGAMPARPPTPEGRYLVILAWGQGFCSDLDHVLGALLLAEMTVRTPVVHWGGGSRFRDEGDADAWTRFFEPVSPLTLDGVLARCPGPLFPPKWNRENIGRGGVNRCAGPGSHMSGILFFSREDAVCVSDFHTGVVSLRSWAPEWHAASGQTVRGVYRALVSAYLRPAAEVVREVEEFAARHFPAPGSGGGRILGLHVRASDKILEDPEVLRFQPRAHERAAAFLAANPGGRVFLLTESEEVAEAFGKQYGERVMMTDCIRTRTLVAPHFQNHASPRRLGMDVVRDLYLAARCDEFFGFGDSNVSCMVSHLKEWPQGACTLVGRFMHEHRLAMYSNDQVASALGLRPPGAAAAAGTRERR